MCCKPRTEAMDACFAHCIMGLLRFFQKHFIDDVKKTISNHHSVNKQLAEGAAVTCVRLCKASTYISIHDRLNVLFSLVQSVIGDLKVRNDCNKNTCSQ